ncbi:MULTISPECIES: FeoA family protein [Priestia]|jgi:ferrous iron transport protein A|uniref:FeoA family protein n=1 Tax=Priestia TaxID=2800373 RepID=UPI0007103341|nr:MULTISPECIES: FeoA family protein [Priestia]KRD99141.1 iron transporter FeoA [Bacillus sp. Root239]MBE5098654.1 ferrous iron transport protein A [Priestia aryabhattai]MBU8687386.1 ferrous iron transport protein A [Priestia megaterium]MCM3545520.1 ferrous iron transport protein A [Priestia megaterium]MDI3093566.1 FeoA family protein [Priestia megaterium]
MASVNDYPLSTFTTGETVQLERIEIEGALKRRLLDLGFIPGAIIKVLQKSPLGDPVAYQVSHTTIGLRKEESSKIYVKKVGDDVE